MEMNDSLYSFAKPAQARYCNYEVRLVFDHIRDREHQLSAFTIILIYTKARLQMSSSFTRAFEPNPSFRYDSTSLSDDLGPPRSGFTRA